MKKLLLLVLTSLLLLPAFPQELKQMRIIGNPQKLKSGEMVARRDQNGNYCAAIKVVSDMTGFSYDSWNGIVGDVDSNPGKDIVYLTAGERVLEVFKSGYAPLQVILSDYGINLQPREVWQIKIAGDEEADVLPVTFRFTPEDATLFIDGEDAGEKLTQELSVGEHRIKLVREDYQTIEENIEVDKDHVFFEWTMEEAPDAGVQITTEPPGAMIYLDGVKLGESPKSIYYPPGNYPIKISKEGYLPIEDEYINITLPQTTKNYTLEENVGYLTINTRPEATVYFNGEKKDDYTRVKLSPQLVQVKVTMPKADDLEEQVVIKKDDDISLNMFPNIQTGTIQVAVTPFDADIELTGDAGEYYTAQGMKIFKDIPVGTYTLKVSAEDHKTTEETVILKSDEKLNKTITLEKGSDADYGIEMVFVKGGTFNMGCTSEQTDCNDDEKPVHEVTVDDFYIGKYEVTNVQFCMFLNEEGNQKEGGETWLDIDDEDCLIEKTGSRYKPKSGYEEHPVIEVTWYGAKSFCDWLNQKTGKKYRLPSEAEWEYAARGGANGLGTKYAGSKNIDDVAWYWKNSGDRTLSGDWDWDKIKSNNCKTHPVGQKQHNELGIYDMSGNVWEWCSDWYGSDYYSSSPRNNPQGPSSGSYRVLRGGSWNLDPQRCRVSLRDDSRPGNANDRIGFRLSRMP